MDNLTSKEQIALDIMQKKNFRGISKANVMELMSILDKVSPDVAKEIISKLPDIIRGAVEVEKGYMWLLDRGIASINSGTASCMDTEDRIIASLQNQLSGTDISFEEQKYYYEKMESAAIRKEEKDTEHKNSILTGLKQGGECLIILAVVVLGIFYG